MEWWTYLYVSLLIYIGYCSVRSSARTHGPIATGLELLTSVAWPLLVMAYFSDEVATLLGKVVVPMFLLALLWTAYTLWRDFRPAVVLPKLPEEERLASYATSVVICAAIVIPVVVLGSLVFQRAW